MNVYLGYLQNMSIVVGWLVSVGFLAFLFIWFIVSFLHQWEEDKNRVGAHGERPCKPVKDEWGNHKFIVESRRARILLRIVAPTALIFGIPLLVGWGRYLDSGVFDAAAFGYYCALVCSIVGFMVLLASALYMVVMPFDDKKPSKLRIAAIYVIGLPVQFFAWPALILAVNVMGS